MATKAIWTGGSGGAPVSGNFTTASNWSTGLVPDANTNAVLNPGAYTVTFHPKAELEQNVRSLTIGNSVRLSMNANDAVVQLVAVKSIVNNGTIIAQSDFADSLADFIGNGDATSTVGTLANNGAIKVADGNSRLNVLGTAFTNSGSVFVGFDSHFLASGVTNLQNGVLTGGSWTVSAGGDLTLYGAVSELGKGTTIALDGEDSIFQGLVQTSDDAHDLHGPGVSPAGLSQYQLEDTLGTIDFGATLAVLGGRDYSAQVNLDDFGTIKLAGGTLAPDTLVIEAKGVLSGYGAVANELDINGSLLATQASDGESGGLILSGPVDLSGVLGGASAVYVTDSLDVYAGAKISVATLELDGAAMSLHTNLKLASTFTLFSSSLDLGGHTLKLTGNAELTGGVVSGDGQLQNTGFMSIDAPSQILSAFQNNGVVDWAIGDTLISGPVTGHGTFELNGEESFEFGSSVASQIIVEFGNATATLKLDDAHDFRGFIENFKNNGQIDLVGFDPATLTLSQQTASDGNTLLQFSSGGNTASLHVDGINFHPGDFNYNSDGHGGTLVSYFEPSGGDAFHI